MKALYITTILLMFGCVALQSCKEDVIEPTQEEIFMEKITGGWTIDNVILDGKDVSKSFPGLSITITDSGQVNVANAVPPIWKGSGSFQLEPIAGTFQLKRDDGVLITVTQPSDDKLILKFQYDADALGGGKVGSVSGLFTFEFNGD